MQRSAHAWVVLPWHSNGMSAQHRRWLARSKLLESPRRERLLQALSALGVAAVPRAFGALRLWGQTGQRPDGWVAAADPVYFEPRRDHLVLHPLGELPAAEVDDIFDHLQENLAAGASVEFLNVGSVGYICRDQPMAAASASPELAQGGTLATFLPSGNEARTHDRLQGEIQMCLHEAEVNRRRAQAGAPPVNALWLWGGGVAPGSPPGSAGSLPALFADDPLFTGYWRSVARPATAWPGDLDACLAGSPEGFVAVLPPEGGANGPSDCDAHLSVLRRMLQDGALRAVTMLFSDGLSAERGRRDGWRLWRRGGPFGQEPGRE